MRTWVYSMHELLARRGGLTRSASPRRRTATLGAAAGRARPALVALAALGLLGACAGLGGGPGGGGRGARGGSGASAVGIVEGIERERFAAMVAVDRPSLDRVLGESLRYCHSNGHCETKAEFVANLLSGQMRYRAIKVLELQPRPVGTAMLVQGRIEIEAEQGGKPLRFQLVYTDVYESRKGVWQMVAWQSTRLP